MVEPLKDITVYQKICSLHPRPPEGYGGIPMKEALTLEQCDRMRLFLKFVSCSHSKADMGEVMRRFRDWNCKRER